MTDCEFCYYNTSCNTIRIANTPHFDIADNVREGDAVLPGSDFTRESYRICMQCFQRLRDPDFVRTIMQNKCELCHGRYAGIRARFTYREDTVRTVRCCSRCLVRLRDSAGRMFNTVMQSSAIRSGNEWDGVIEFKDRVCYIWNPIEVEIKRAQDRGTRVSVTIEERSRDTSFARAQAVQRALIYDGDTIWILENPHITSLRSNTNHLFGDFGETSPSFHMREKLELEFLCDRVEARSVDAERSRQNTSALAGRRITGISVNRLDSRGRDAIHNELYTVGDGSWGADSRIRVDESGLCANRTFALPSGNHDFSQVYDDPAGRILVYCSCGFEKRISPSQNTVTHDGVTVTVQSVLYNPGSHTTTQIGEHTVTMRSPSRRDPLQ